MKILVFGVFIGVPVFREITKSIEFRVVRGALNTDQREQLILLHTRSPKV